ncbi:MAG: bi-domain-containing oxidoreductase [bacterium]
MKQVLIKNGAVTVAEIPAPGCPAGFILVENRYSLISTGTESSTVKQGASSLVSKAMEQPELIRKTLESLKDVGLLSTWELVKEEKNKTLLLGYSCAGVVRKVGAGVNNFSPGDRVACAGAGFANHSEFVAVPRNLAVKLPEKVDFSQAAFTTLGAVALQGVRQARVELGYKAVVSGLGLLGLLTVQILKAAGCSVIGIDPDESRVRKAIELGCDLGLDATASSPENKKLVDRFTEGMGVDVAVICAATASSGPVRQAIDFCRKKGRVVVVGAVGMELERSPFYEKELEFTISCSYGPGRYDPGYEIQGHDYPYGYVRFTENRNMREFVRLLAGGKVKLDTLCQREYRIEEAVSAYNYLQENKSLGLLLRYREENKEPIGRVSLKPARKKRKQVRVAVAGLGAMAANIHLPNLNRISGCEITALVSQRGTEADKLAEKYGAAFSATSLGEVAGDVDMVLIANRDHLHAKTAMEAARADLAVFCEKPMAINQVELEELSKVIQETGVNFTVGFNRRFSPLAVKARQLLEQRSGPALVYFRVNAETVPQSHWVNNPGEAAGRFVGEGCHFVDFLNFLFGSAPAEVAAFRLSAPGRGEIDDNVSASLKYPDGSVGCITYVTVGDGGLAKERLEIFADRKSMVLDNFQALELYGYSGETEIRLPAPDKGWKRQLEEFIKQVQGKPSTGITLEEAAAASLWTLKIRDAFSEK